MFGNTVELHDAETPVLWTRGTTRQDYRTSLQSVHHEELLHGKRLISLWIKKGKAKKLGLTTITYLFSD